MRKAYQTPQVRSLGSQELLQVIGPVQGYGGGGVAGLTELGADGRYDGGFVNLD